MTRRSSNWMGCFLIGATGEGVTRTGDALLGGVSDDPYDVRTFVRVVNRRDFRDRHRREPIAPTLGSAPAAVVDRFRFTTGPERCSR